MSREPKAELIYLRRRIVELATQLGTKRKWPAKDADMLIELARRHSLVLATVIREEGYRHTNTIE